MRFTATARAAIVGIGLHGLLATSAAAEPVASGETTLKLDRPVANVLKKNGVTVSPVKPAKVKQGGIAFPVTGGNLDPKTGAGVLRHPGGLKFSAGGNRLVARSFVVRTGKGNVLTGKVGGSQVRLLKLDLDRAKLKRDGLGLEVSKVGASLTGAAARALNSTFGVKLFKANLRIGHVVVKAQPEMVRLESRGSTDLTLDPGTAEALAGLGVTAAPVDPAAVTPSGAIAFPITGGRADTSTFAGTVSHSGGISLTAGEVRVELTQFRINIDDEPDLTAKLGDQRVSILSLDLSALEPSVKGRRITLANVGAKLTAEAASALNAAFSTTAFTEGLVLGKATVKAVAR